MDKIEYLKEIERAYQITYDWEYCDKYTKEEYLKLMSTCLNGKYLKYNLFEIMQEICKAIREL